MPRPGVGRESSPDEGQRLELVAADSQTFPGFTVVARVRPDRRGGQLTMSVAWRDHHLWLVGPVAGGLLAGCGAGGVAPAIDRLLERGDIGDAARESIGHMVRGDRDGWWATGGR